MTNPVIDRLGRKLRLAVIGGASGSLIGSVHRAAALFDNRFEIVAGVLSSNPERARAEGVAIGLAAARAYGEVTAMIAAERSRADGIDAVTIMTPNDSHHRLARAAIDAGLDVICDKPLCNTLAEAEDLAKAVRERGGVFCLTHSYAGYPMLREARAQVASGRLGAVRLVQVEYFGSGLAARVEDLPDAGRRWRLDPARSGPSLVLGDIGTHAHHLANFVVGEPIARLSAEVGTLMPGRKVQDYASLRARFASGARATLTLCQAAAGAENHISIRVFGERGHLAWSHREHNQLIWAPLEGFAETMTRGNPRLSPAARRATRIGRTGHPEGLHEAFANLYADAAEAIAARRAGAACDPLALDFPTVEDGVRGVRFVDAALRSQAADGAWVEC